MGTASAGLIQSGEVRFKVEIALETGESGSSLWDAATWNPGGDGIWSALEPSWIDVSALTLSAQWNRGKDRWDQRARAGSASCDFDNTEGQFNPTFGATLPGQLTLRPGRLIRISGDAGEGYIPQFTGVIDSIDDIYRDGAHDITTRVQAFDWFGYWAIHNPPALESPIAAERPDQRIDRLLDLVGHPTEWRALETAVHNLQASNLGRAYLDEMGIAADSEGGLFFIDGNAFAVMQNQDYRTTNPRATSFQWSVGNGDVDALKLLAADGDWSLQRIQNDIRLARAGGTEQRVQNTASDALYGQRTFARFDYENTTDAEVEALANIRLEENQWDAIRIDTITIEATTQEATRDLLGAQLTDRIRVFILPRAGEWGYAQDVHINRIRGRVDASDFSYTLRVDDAVTSAPDDAHAFNVDAFSDGFL